jgi:hypothetical protein
MREEKFFGSTHQRIMKGKIISRFLALLAILAFVYPSVGYADADPVTKLEYVFSEPKLERINEYYSIYMPDTGKLHDDIRLPLLPVKTAKILIPQGHDVKTINIVLGKKITLDGEFMIEYAKPQIPIGSNETVEAQLNEEVYSSRNPFPGKLHSVLSTQFLSGYKILILNLFPVEYIPALGKVSYYERMKVIVVNVPSGPPHIRRAKCRKLSSDNARVKKLVDNPSEVSNYTAEVTPTEGPYEYVIITNEDMIAAFQTLADWKESRGITTYVETIETIKANHLYVGSDLQEKIRSFIDYAYDTWGTTYVLLGGDGDTVKGKRGGPIPYRGVYGKHVGLTKTYIDKDIPCDMYYGALGGNWDNDGDGIYGEGDSSGGGTGDEGDEADYLAEVFIGRIPADNATEAYNQIDKIIAYESSLHTTSALLVGCRLDDVPTYGGDHKDIVYTYFPSDWGEATTLYERDETYSQTRLINEMNSNKHHIVNYMSHSGYWNDMGLSNDQIAGLFNTRYFLAYSQGCDAGGFDRGTRPWDDCAGEHFTVENGNGGAFAYIGNTRYGFYSPGSLEGPSQQFDEQFFDAIFNEPIKNIGKALQDSKEDLLTSVEATGAMRWCYFELCLLGDPETPISEEPPVPPDIILPANVADLTTGDTTANSIVLTWTAPGDDAIEGTASEYDIRYSTSGPIDTEGKWDIATQCTGEPSPSSPGTLESFTVTGLSPSTTYWFALKTADEVPNWSGISNSSSGKTQEAGPQTMHISAIDMSLKIAGPNVNAFATVTIVGAFGAPVSGATVSGTWSEATTNIDSGVTGSNGQVTLKSNRVRKPTPGTTFTFTVDNVVKDGWTYVPGTVTSGFITYE